MRLLILPLAALMVGLMGLAVIRATKDRYPRTAIVLFFGWGFVIGGVVFVAGIMVR